MTIAVDTVAAAGVARAARARAKAKARASDVAAAAARARGGERAAAAWDNSASVLPWQMYGRSVMK